MKSSSALLSQPISRPMSVFLPGLHASASSIESWRLEICISSPIPATNRIMFRRHFVSRRNTLNGWIRSRVPISAIGNPVAVDLDLQPYESRLILFTDSAISHE